jgi:Fe-S-cluster containining protein
MSSTSTADKPSVESPWYVDGLRFTCTGCGDCCTGGPGFVWVNQEEIEALAARLGMTPAAFEAKFVRRIGVRRSLKERKNYDCVFLDAATRQCTVYEDRPRQCRTWPFWNSTVKAPETWERTCAVCPGCGHGKLYTLEDIDVQRSAINI